MKPPFVFCIVLMALFACNEKGGKAIVQEPRETGLNGQQLAEIQCASCHSYVPPSVLPRSVWQNDVLPAMGHRLGIFSGDNQPDSIFGSPANALVVKKAHIYSERPLLAKKDWQKIVDYYVRNAPETLSPPQRNPTINMGLKHFR